MKRYLAIAVGVLLLGGLTAYLTHNPTEMPEEGVQVKAKVAKAAKAATPVETKPQPGDGLMTGSIGSLVFTDEIAEKQPVQQ